MSAAAADAEHKTKGQFSGAHVAHLSAEKRAALAAGERLQPAANPHASRLLREYIARPTRDAHARFCAEFWRGPVFVLVSEQEMALRESEAQVAAMRYSRSGAALPRTMAFAPLLFHERDADRKEDGDALMVKRSAGTLAPDYAYRRRSCSVSVYTDTDLIAEAVTHPQLHTSGADRMSYIGLSVASLRPWVEKECLKSDVVLYLNRWTPQEVRLSSEDLSVLFFSEGAAAAEVSAAGGTLAEDFTGMQPTIDAGTVGDSVSETWNTLQDKRDDYAVQRRQMLRARREAEEAGQTHRLPPPGEEAKALDSLVKSVAGIAEAEAKAVPALASSAGDGGAAAAVVADNGLEEEPGCPRECKLAIVSVALQRAELRAVYAKTLRSSDSGSEEEGGTGGGVVRAVALRLYSKDFALTSAKIHAVLNYFKQEGVPFPEVVMEAGGDGEAPLEEVVGAYGLVYRKPANYLHLGRLHKDGPVVSKTALTA